MLKRDEQNETKEAFAALVDIFKGPSKEEQEALAKQLAESVHQAAIDAVKDTEMPKWVQKLEAEDKANLAMEIDKVLSKMADDTKSLYEATEKVTTVIKESNDKVFGGVVAKLKLEIAGIKSDINDKKRGIFARIGSIFTYLVTMIPLIITTIASAVATLTVALIPILVIGTLTLFALGLVAATIYTYWDKISEFFSKKFHGMVKYLNELNWEDITNRIVKFIEEDIPKFWNQYIKPIAADIADFGKWALTQGWDILKETVPVLISFFSRMYNIISGIDAALYNIALMIPGIQAIEIKKPLNRIRRAETPSKALAIAHRTYRENPRLFKDEDFLNMLVYALMESGLSKFSAIQTALNLNRQATRGLIADRQGQEILESLNIKPGEPLDQSLVRMLSENLIPGVPKEWGIRPNYWVYLNEGRGRNYMQLSPEDREAILEAIRTLHISPEELANSVAESARNGAREGAKEAGTSHPLVVPVPVGNNLTDNNSIYIGRQLPILESNR